MIKVKTFRSPWNMEDSLSRYVQNFLNNNHLNKENIVDIKYSTNNDWIYCTLIQEE